MIDGAGSTDQVLHIDGSAAGHTTGVAQEEASPQGLPTMSLQGWEEQDQSDSGSGGEQPADAQLDSFVFDDRWKAQMEELSKVGEDELYLTESSTGYLPDDWTLNRDRIHSCLQAVGLTDRLLGYQVGDERTILEQEWVSR